MTIEKRDQNRERVIEVSAKYIEMHTLKQSISVFLVMQTTKARRVDSTEFPSGLYHTAEENIDLRTCKIENNKDLTTYRSKKSMKI